MCGSPRYEPLTNAWVCQPSHCGFPRSEEPGVSIFVLPFKRHSSLLGDVFYVAESVVARAFVRRAYDHRGMAHRRLPGAPCTCPSPELGTRNAAVARVSPRTLPPQPPAGVGPPPIDWPMLRSRGESSEEPMVPSRLLRRSACRVRPHGSCGNCSSTSDVNARGTARQSCVTLWKWCALRVPPNYSPAMRPARAVRPAPTPGSAHPVIRRWLWSVSAAGRVTRLRQAGPGSDGGTSGRRTVAGALHGWCPCGPGTR
jgi:hypothetical protein